MTIVFDIETGPLPNARDFLPSFRPNAGWKDPEKIEAARLKHEQDSLAEAALDPLTARVLVIAYQVMGSSTPPPWGYVDNPTIQTELGEKEILRSFWGLVIREPLTTLVGFRSNSFDLPMLFARSWANGLIPPAHLRRGRYFSDYSVDLQEVWLCGGKKTEGVSLDRVCRALGLGRKSENGVTGANFSEVYFSDRDKALEYARQDLNLTCKLYETICR